MYYCYCNFLYVNGDSRICIYFKLSLLTYISFVYIFDLLIFTRACQRVTIPKLFVCITMSNVYVYI